MKNIVGIAVFLFLLVFNNLVNAQYIAIKNAWIDSTTNVIQCTECDSVLNDFGSNLRYIKNGKFGIYSVANKTFTNSNFDYINVFKESKTTAREGTTWYIVNENLEKLKTLKAHYVYEFSEGLARFQLGNRFGYFNLQGEEQIPLMYWGAYSFKEGLARVYNGKKWGYINKNNQVIIEFEFDFAWDFSESIAVVGIKHKQSYWYTQIDKKGKKLGAYSENYFFPKTENLSLLRKGDYFRYQLVYLNHDNNTEISIPYKDAQAFSGGLAACFSNGKWGYIDRNGVLIIPHQFDHAANFEHGLIYTQIEGKKIVANTKGNIIWKAE